MPASRPFIDCHSLEMTYGHGPAAVAALQRLDLAVPAGQSLALTGPSGSGKSTLLHLIGALEAPSAGRIRVGDLDLGDLTDAAASRYRGTGLGFVFQFFHLAPALTAQANVALPGRLAGLSAAVAARRAHDLLGRVGLDDRCDAYPETLSGGQQQRVALARALINEPPLLLADEPTGNLDRRTGEQILGLLGELVAERGLTLVMATHSQRACQLADRTVQLEDGRIRHDSHAP